MMSGHSLYGALPFAVSVEQSGGRLVVAPRGELDLASAPAIERVLGETLANIQQQRPGQVSVVELDLARLDFLDLAGVRAIRRCGEIARAHGVCFELGELSPQAQRLFELCEALMRRN